MRPWPSYRRRVQRLPGDPRIAWPALRGRGLGPPDETDSSTEIEEEHPRDGVARGFPDRVSGPTSERNPNGKGVGPGQRQEKRLLYGNLRRKPATGRGVRGKALSWPRRGLAVPPGPRSVLRRRVFPRNGDVRARNGVQGAKQRRDGVPEYTGRVTSPLGPRGPSPWRAARTATNTPSLGLGVPSA